MKKFFAFAMMFAAFTLVACGSEQKKDEKAENKCEQCADCTGDCENCEECTCEEPCEKACEKSECCKDECEKTECCKDECEKTECEKTECCGDCEKTVVVE